MTHQAAANPLRGDGTASGHGVGPFMMQAEMHTGTNFLNAVINQNYVDPALKGTSAAFGPLFVTAEERPLRGKYGITDGSCALLGDCWSHGTECDYNVQPDRFCCWKHGYSDRACLESAFSPPLQALVTIERDPYAWLLSLFRKPYEYEGMPPKKLHDFLRQPFAYSPKIYSLLGIDVPADSRASPVDRWVAKVEASRAANASVPTIQLRHIDLYYPKRLERMLDRLLSLGYVRRNASSFDLPLIDEPFEQRPDDKLDGRFTRRMYYEAREYEQAKEWQALYSADDVAYVQKRLPAYLAAEYPWTPGAWFNRDVVQMAAGGSRQMVPLIATGAMRPRALTERQRNLHDFLDGVES